MHTFFGCAKKEKVYPNFNTTQFVQSIEWGTNFHTINSLFSSKYNLVFSKRIEQPPSASPNKTVYEFDGGVFNNISLQKTICSFNNDSLFFVNFMFFDDESEALKKDFNILTESFSNSIVETRLDLEFEKEFVLKIREDRKDLVQIALNHNSNILHILFNGFEE